MPSKATLKVHESTAAADPATPPGSAIVVPPPVPVIHPRAVYGLESARLTAGVSRGCLPREIRLGRLRVAKRGGKYFILGEWLLEWLRGGEVTRRRREPETAPA